MSACLDGKGMPDEWKISLIVPIFKGKSDVVSCGSYRGVILLEHAMKIVERVLERRIRTLVNLNEMQFDLCQEKEQWMRYSLREECRRNIKRRTRSCICVFLTWNNGKDGGFD